MASDSIMMSFSIDTDHLLPNIFGYLTPVVVTNTARIVFRNS